MADLMGTVLGMVLTLFVFSYVIGENFLYRLAIYIFTGLTVGFVSVSLYDNVIQPWITGTLLSGNVGQVIFGALPLLLALLLLLPGGFLGGFRKIALAVIISVGAAVAIVGALTGTLLPMIEATGNGVSANVFMGGFTLLGVLSSLIYFQYSARRQDDGTSRRNVITQLFSRIGSFFIAVAFGTFYGAALITALTIFNQRIEFLLQGVSRLFNGG